MSSPRDQKVKRFPRIAGGDESAQLKKNKLQLVLSGMSRAACPIKWGAHVMGVRGEASLHAGLIFSKEFGL